MESTTYLLIDEDGKEHAIFSGDTLFLGDVGRSDLAQKAANMTQEELAGLLYESLNNKIMPLGEPKTGDVVVFRFPNDPKIDFIKRLVGVPGDVIAWDNKELKVNGVPVARQELGEYAALDQNGQVHPTLRLKETLGTVNHDILLLPGTAGRIGEVVVPAGHYFVMGDNRDMSNDGRMWGLVPEENLVGKAMLVWMHINWGEGGDGLNLKRIGLID